MKLLRRKEAASRVGFHPVHVMRKANDPGDDFPRPVRIGPNAVAFVEDEIEAWIKRRVAERGDQVDSEDGAGGDEHALSDDR